MRREDNLPEWAREDVESPAERATPSAPAAATTPAGQAKGSSASASCRIPSSGAQPAAETAESDELEWMRGTPVVASLAASSASEISVNISIGVMPPERGQPEEPQPEEPQELWENPAQVPSQGPDEPSHNQPGTIPTNLLI